MTYFAATTLQDSRPQAAERIEMTTPPTPLPEPAIYHWHQPSINAPDYVKCVGFTKAQLRQYSEAEYRRGIEDSAQVCQDYDNCNPDYIAAAIRKLGEKS